MRIWLKRLGIICLIPVVLVLLVSILLYVPAVQNVMVRKAINYASETTGMDMDFERLRVSFPLGLSVNNVSVATAGGDTLFHLNKLTVDVRLRPLFEGNVLIDGIRLEALNLNTGMLLDGVIVKGHVGSMYLNAGFIETAEERLLLNKVSLSDADIDMFYCDIAAADTTTSVINWRIDLESAELKNVNFLCRMPCDSLYIDVRLNDATLSDGVIDLGAKAYGASGFRAGIDTLFYGTDLDEAAPGLDLSHIHLSDIALSLDSLHYGSDGKMSAILRECYAKERSGLVLKSAVGRVEADSVSIELPSLLIETNHSTIRLQALVPWSSVDAERPEGRFTLNVSASINKHDALLVIGDKSPTFRTYYPDTLFTLNASATGNLRDITLRKLQAALPGAFNMNVTGNVLSPTDERLRSGKLDCAVETYDMDFIVGMFPSLLQERFRIPDSMSLTGSLTMNKGLYTTEMELRESDGKIRLSGNYNVFSEQYRASLTVDSLEPINFMPRDSIMWLSASVRLRGQGRDIYSPATWANVRGQLRDIRYGESSMSDVSLLGSLKEHQLKVELNSAYPLIRGSITVDGEVRKDKIKGMIIADVDSLDLYGLKLTEIPMATSFQVFSELESDLDKIHSLDVTLGNWSLIFERQSVQPKMLTLAFRSDTNTTRTSFRAGDFDVLFTGNADYMTLADNLSQLSSEVVKQFERDSTVDIQELRPYFPDISLKLSAERDNPLYNYLQESNVFFEGLSLDATISPEEGLNINGSLLALVKDTFKIDSININVWQDTLGLLYNADIIKNRFRNQEAFFTNISGYLRKNEGDVFASFFNSRGEQGLNLGINAQKVGDIFDLNFYPEKPIIAFLPFKVNNNNYFRFRSLKDMDANLRLEGSSNASLWIHTGNESESMKEIMIELSQIDLEKTSSGFMNLPSLKGLLNATLRYEPMETSFMVVADGNIDNFYYEDGRIGELLLNATYMPMEKGTHQVDVHVFHEMKNVSSLSVLYKEGRNEDHIEGIWSVEQLPLNILNAMIPGQMAQLNGFLQGDLAIKGTSKSPIINGAIRFDKASLYVASSATTLTFDERPINVTNNRMKFDKYHMSVTKDNPLVIDGIVDATNTNRPMVDLNMTANNLPLIDSRRTSESLAYGRLFVNINSTLKGPVESLVMRGNMRVLGSTNMTYVMTDSPLEVRDGFNDLVTFSYFADTLPRRTRRPFNLMGGARNMAAMSGTDVLLNIRIDPVVRIRVDLSEDNSNYVEWRGGGDLSLQYTTQGDMSLNGRYTLSDGTMRYSIPVIPLTDFSIRNGSYADWSGDPMNPYLNIAAHTRVRSSATINGQSQMADFNAGIQLQDNLENVSVKFILEAPSNDNIQNQLVAMGEEERSKQAISLLVAGVYLTNGGVGSDDVGTALNSLLQREIKNMLGSLLGEVPFSFDVNSYDGTEGKGRRIDYIGRFHKGFFNERLNTTLGFRYSDNKDTVPDNVSLSNFLPYDMSLEYRLDTDGSRAIKVFRSTEYKNLFEGEITNVGASFMLKRKVKKLSDLFILKKRKKPIGGEN